MATHQIPNILGLFSIHELLNDDKYEFEVARRKIRFLLKARCLKQSITIPPLSAKMRKTRIREKEKQNP